MIGSRPGDSWTSTTYRRTLGLGTLGGGGVVRTAFVRRSLVSVLAAAALVGAGSVIFLQRQDIDSLRSRPTTVQGGTGGIYGQADPERRARDAESDAASLQQRVTSMQIDLDDAQTRARQAEARADEDERLLAELRSAVEQYLHTTSQYSTGAPVPDVRIPTAMCNDGTASYAQNHQGACSSHGGVAMFTQ